MKLKTLFAALVVCGMSAAHAGSILIVNGGTSEPGTTAAVTDNLTDLHIAVGNTVTVVGSLPASLASYSQVWDIRFNVGLDGAGATEYTNYLNSGGGLFLMGENGGFMSRNNSILSLVSGLGGGNLGYTSCYDGVEKVHAPFTGPNAVASVNYAASGCFNSKGTGQWITSRSDESMGAGVAFGVGSLSGALAGALTTILDVNFMMEQYDLPYSQNLTKNLIGYVGDQVDPPHGVPEPGALALVGIAILAVGASRKRRIG